MLRKAVLISSLIFANQNVLHSSLSRITSQMTVAKKFESDIYATCPYPNQNIKHDHKTLFLLYNPNNIIVISNKINISYDSMIMIGRFFFNINKNKIKYYQFVTV